MTTWKEAQAWEAAWHGKCLNTFGEEMKQLLYATKMGLHTFHDGKSPYNIDMGGKSVLDVGGGPVSLLLKCTNLGKVKVVDPLLLPDWVKARYNAAGIAVRQIPAEEMRERGWDEVWMYNVLQHTDDPVAVTSNLLEAGRIVRMFEWIETGTNVGHPHEFTAERLDLLLGGEGRVEKLTGEANCVGKCYYGVFAGTS